MADLKKSWQIIVVIYNYICPIFIWVETIKKELAKTDTFKQTPIFKYLKQMRNEASHLDISQNKTIETLFIKIVLVYDRFGLNLSKESVEIQKIWKDLQNDYSNRHLIKILKTELENIETSYYGYYQANLRLFQSILNKISNQNKNKKSQYQILIRIISQFISPIIIWHQQMINEETLDCKLFQLVSEIKNKVCHLYKYTNCANLKEILKSILVIYQCFGVDLRYYNWEINEVDFQTIPLCIKYGEMEIKKEVRKILKSQSNMRKYILNFKDQINYIITKDFPRTPINMNTSFNEGKETNSNGKNNKFSNDEPIQTLPHVSVDENLVCIESENDIIDKNDGIVPDYISMDINDEESISRSEISETKTDYCKYLAYIGLSLTCFLTIIIIYCFVKLFQ